MSRWIALIALAALLPAPALAGSPAKKPTCQTSKPSTRDAKKVEPCRKNAPIPWLVDPSPLFLAAAEAADAPGSDLT